MTTFDIFHTTRVRKGIRGAPHIWGAGEIRDVGERRLFWGLARSKLFVTPHIWGTGEMSTEISATYLGRWGNKHWKSRRIYVALGHDELMVLEAPVGARPCADHNGGISGMWGAGAKPLTACWGSQEGPCESHAMCRLQWRCMSEWYQNYKFHGFWFILKVLYVKYRPLCRPRPIKYDIFSNGPLTRYAKLPVAHAPGMLEMFSPPPTPEETAN